MKHNNDGAARLKGRVRWYSAQGYGFLDSLPAAGAAYYFHISSVKGRPAMLNVGDEVTFIPTKNAKGLRAIEVQLNDTKDISNATSNNPTK